MRLLAFCALLCTATTIVASCSNAPSNRETVVDAPTQTEAGITGVPAEPSDSIPLSERKFIRTSQMKFKVKDVVAVTQHIEDITRLHHGFVTNSELNSEITSQNTVATSNDSALEITNYVAVSNITLRVPNVYLDTTLKAIAGFVDFLDYRTIKADDVAIQVLANKKTQNRALRSGNAVQQRVNGNGGSLKDVVTATSLDNDLQKQVDDAAIANLSMLDQVNYSTVAVTLYQGTQQKTSTVALANIDKRSGMGLRLANALRTGWHLMEDVLVAVANLWVFILAGVAIWFAVKKLKYKRTIKVLR